MRRIANVKEVFFFFFFFFFFFCLAAVKLVTVAGFKRFLNSIVALHLETMLRFYGACPLSATTRYIFAAGRKNGGKKERKEIYPFFLSWLAS